LPHRSHNRGELCGVAMGTFFGLYEGKFVFCGGVYCLGVDCVDALLNDVRVWKEQLVAVEGVGADCAPAVVGFDELGGVLGVAVLCVPVGGRVEQFERCVGAMGLMRGGWGAFGLAVVLEGYLATGGVGLGGSLVERFAGGDGSVVETISVVFRDAGGGSRVVSLPYRVGLGRRVVWLDELFCDVSDELVSGGYPGALFEVFGSVVPRVWSSVVPFEVPFLAVSAELSDLGFAVVSPFLEGVGEDFL
jgi:hypothetical protein